MEMNVKSLEPRRRFLSDFIIFLRYLADKVLQNLVTVCNRRSIFGFNILRQKKSPLREYALCIIMSEYFKIVNCTVWQEKKKYIAKNWPSILTKLNFFLHTLFLLHIHVAGSQSYLLGGPKLFTHGRNIMHFPPFFFPFYHIFSPKVCLAKFKSKIKIHTPGTQSLIE